LVADGGLLCMSADNPGGVTHGGGHCHGRRGPPGRHVSPRRLIRRPVAVAAAVTGVVMLCGAAAGLAWASHTGRPATPAGAPPIVAIPRGAWATVPPAKAVHVSRPTALVIPAIGVRTRLIGLKLTRAGKMQVPPNPAVAGWYTGSPRPGAAGATVIAGHVDSRRGPAVFFRLRELRPGELIFVRRAHSSLAVFRVTAVRVFAKARFPTAAVYNAVPNSQLRLITCGGNFDPATGHYVSNVIVFAVLQRR